MMSGEFVRNYELSELKCPDVIVVNIYEIPEYIIRI